MATDLNAQQRTDPGVASPPASSRAGSPGVRPGAPRGNSARTAWEFADALASGGLSLDYQPIVDLRSYRVAGLEALARWWVPAEGWRAPDGWIRLAEERGLIIPFGRWVLSTALRQIAALQSGGHGRLPVAVNLSPLQLDDPDFPTSWRPSCWYTERKRPTWIWS